MHNVRAKPSFCLWATSTARPSAVFTSGLINNPRACLEDRRGITVVRHLRRAYRDPFTGKAFALVQTPDGRGIAGVHSQSTRHPFKIAGFSAQDAAFAEAKTIADWQFVFIPPAPLPANQQTPVPANRLQPGP